MLHGHRFGRWMPIVGKLGAYAAAVPARLRNLAPYAVIALVVPGGSLMAAMLWRYRRRQHVR
jgi:hypothetical protein